MSETWIVSVNVTDPELRSTLVGDNVKELIVGPEKSCPKEILTKRIVNSMNNFEFKKNTSLFN